jgi:acyl-CoA reductase-like NAD-dependent aldehyde dehydrogenase
MVAHNWGMIELIESAARTGRTDLAAEALQRLTTKAQACRTEWALGIEARSRALLSTGDIAERGFRDWGARSAAERARVLRAAAAHLRERRLEFAALQVRECAKPWPQADADVCEAIDFLEYYADEAIDITDAIIKRLDTAPQGK